MTPLLAFLNLGPSEIALLLVLLVLLFGADKIPQLARSLGKARAELDRAQGQVRDALRTEEERRWDEQVAFEREREAHIAQADADRQALARAAHELGIDAAGKSDAELRAAIAARVGSADQG